MRQYLNLSITFVISLVLFLVGCEKPKEPDTTPPSVAITFPVAGAIAFEIVTITCVATDNEGISKVQLWIDGYKQEGIEDSNEPYELRWNTTSYDDGSAHVITVRAYDKSDNVTDSDPVAIIVDNTFSYPAAVNISSIAYTMDEMTVIWEKSDAGDFIKYDLLYADSEQGIKETLVTINDINDTTYTLTDFDPGHESWYWVSVTDSLEYSSIGSSYVVLDSVPMQIEINKITYGNNAFIIQWSQSVDEDFSKYLLYESNFEDMEGELVVFESGNVSDTTYTVQGVGPGDLRYYRLVVQDIWGLESTSLIKPAMSILFAATFTNDWLCPDCGEGIIFISDTDGNVLAEATWTGNTSFEIDFPADLATFPENISITTVTGDEHGNVVLTTNLNIPVGSSWTWKGYQYPDWGNPVGTVEFDFQNIPDHAGYILSSLWSSRSSTSGTLGSPYSFNFYESPMDIYLKLNTTDSGQKYLWINDITGGNYQVDLSNLQTTNTTNITLPSGITGFDIFFYGYPIPGSHSAGRYRLDRVFAPDSSVNEISANYPYSSFTDYRTSLYMYENNQYYGEECWYQSTYGDIPSSFIKIDADFDFVSVLPDNFQIQTTGTFDQIISKWRINDSDYYIQWNVYGPPDQPQYSLPILPNSVIQNYSYVDRGLFELDYSNLFDYSELSSYEDILNILFNSPDYFYDVVNDSRARVKFYDSNGILQRKGYLGDKSKREEDYEIPYFR